MFGPKTMPASMNSGTVGSPRRTPPRASSPHTRNAPPRAIRASAPCGNGSTPSAGRRRHRGPGCCSERARRGVSWASTSVTARPVATEPGGSRRVIASGSTALEVAERGHQGHRREAADRLGDHLLRDPDRGRSPGRRTASGRGPTRPPAPGRPARRSRRRHGWGPGPRAEAPGGAWAPPRSARGPGPSPRTRSPPTGPPGPAARRAPARRDPPGVPTPRPAGRATAAGAPPRTPRSPSWGPPAPSAASVGMRSAGRTGERACLESARRDARAEWGPAPISARPRGHAPTRG